MIVCRSQRKVARCSLSHGSVTSDDLLPILVRRTARAHASARADGLSRRLTTGASWPWTER